MKNKKRLLLSLGLLALGTATLVTNPAFQKGWAEGASRPVAEANPNEIGRAHV